MQFSRFGQKFCGGAGITRLMDDLGAALADSDMLMLGGGNPAHIPEVKTLYCGI
jgi:valine--pyruvate aminotransferase